MKMKNPRQVLSWCLFDFANSGYSAVIAAVIFPVYYASVIVGNQAGLGDLWWGRAISISMAFVAVTSPFLGGIADYSGRRKRLLFVYTVVCVLSVACFSMLERGMVVRGFLLAALANVGMEGGLVFYNSFLPEIAKRDHQGRVSAWGFGVGYAGSILSLLLALPLVKSGDYKQAWLMVAGFFFVFSLPAFFFLPQDRGTGRGVMASASEGLKYSLRTLAEIWNRRAVRRFLLAFLLYEDGVNTVIVFSSIFASSTLGFGAKELVALYLVVQVTALVGAFVMARPIDSWGPKPVIVSSLCLWIAVSVAAFFVREKEHFWAVASCAGLGLGTVQAASRAFFARLIPEEREGEYFGIYSLVGKSSAIAGPLVFGTVSSVLGSQRPAVLAIAVFFVLGLIFIARAEGGGPNRGDFKAR